jgi:hypothetical protein
VSNFFKESKLKNTLRTYLTVLFIRRRQVLIMGWVIGSGIMIGNIGLPNFSPYKFSPFEILSVLLRQLISYSSSFLSSFLLQKQNSHFLIFLVFCTNNGEQESISYMFKLSWIKKGTEMWC